MAMIGTGCLGGGLFAFFWGLRCYQRRRLLQNTPRSKVEAVALGPAELSGRAVPHESMTSPIEQLPCVYWRYKVEEWRQRGKNSSWVTIDHGESRVPFYLEDETGKIMVVPDGATIDVPKNLQVEASNSPLRSELPACVFAFAEQKGIELDGVFTPKKRFTEWMIAAHATVFVFGPVIAVEGEHFSEAKSGSRIVCQDGSCPLFLIANTSAQTVEAEFAWKAAAGVIGGGLLAVVGLGIILDYYHML
jgi:hypothetical protein